MPVTGDDEEIVNTYTTDSQDSPRVARLDDGGWVVVWRSLSQDGDDWGIYLQRFGPSGTKLGDEERVNTTVIGAQFGADVTGLTDGGWVVTWRTDDGETSDTQYGVCQQRYDSNGDKAGGESFVAAMSVNHLADPSVIALSDGGWLTCWSSDGVDGDDAAVVLSRYTATGTLVGSPTIVNNVVTDDQDYPTVTALKSGGWVVTYTSNNQDGDGWGVAQRVFNSQGQSLGDSVIVNHTTAGTQLYPRSAALADGGWVVVWQNGFGSSGDIVIRRYDSSGATAGDDIGVNTLTNGSQTAPAVEGLTNGGWVVAWSDSVNDGGGYGVYFQVYDSDGERVGDQTLANVTTAFWQSNPDISALPDGRFVITWQSDAQDGDDNGVYQRVFDSGIPDPPPDGDENHAPVANPDKAKVGEYGEVLVKVLRNDTDEDGDPLSVTSAEIVSGDGSVRINEDHTLTYDAGSAIWDLGKGEKATVKVRYTISDGDEASTTVVKITVNGVATDIAGNARGNKLDGTKASEVIDGRGGADKIDGKAGDDVLIGGSGADVFRFKTGCDEDLVVDFETDTDRHDRLDLRGMKSIGSFEDLVTNRMINQGDDVLIDAGKGDRIVLKNVLVEELGEQHFMF